MGAVPPATGAAALMQDMLARVAPDLATNDAARALCLHVADVCAALLTLARVPPAPAETVATPPRVRTEHLPGGRRRTLSLGGG